jgi:hypothetical protein
MQLTDATVVFYISHLDPVASQPDQLTMPTGDNEGLPSRIHIASWAPSYGIIPYRNPRRWVPNMQHLMSSVNAARGHHLSRSSISARGNGGLGQASWLSTNGDATDATHHRSHPRITRHMLLKGSPFIAELIVGKHTAVSSPRHGEDKTGGGPVGQAPSLESSCVRADCLAL